eukprot:2700572-Pyramimonas_sp.AAC.1
MGKDQWKQFASGPVDKLDVEDLVQWAVKLRPRSVHDFKPLLILMQGLLQDFLDGKLKAYHKDMQELCCLLAEREEDSAAKIKEMSATMAEMHAKLQAVDWTKM